MLDGYARTETTPATASFVSTVWTPMTRGWRRRGPWLMLRQKNLRVTRDLLPSGTLEVWTHNKAIQKMCESYRIDAATKAALRALRR